MIDRLFEIIFILLGRVLFPRRQDWQQRRDAKILSGVIFFP